LGGCTSGWLEWRGGLGGVVAQVAVLLVAQVAVLPGGLSGVVARVAVLPTTSVLQ